MRPVGPSSGGSSIPGDAGLARGALRSDDARGAGGGEHAPSAGGGCRLSLPRVPRRFEGAGKEKWHGPVLFNHPRLGVLCLGIQKEWFIAEAWSFSTERRQHSTQNVLCPQTMIKTEANVTMRSLGTTACQEAKSGSSAGRI